MPYGDRLHDCGADTGIYHYLDRCAANLYIGGFSINQGIGGGFTWLAESHAWAGLGALKYLLLVSLVICVIQFIDSDSQLISQTKKEQSLLYYPMESFAGIFFPAAKEVTQQYIFK